MSRRSGRGNVETEAVLEKLGQGRAGAVQVLREAKIGSKPYREAGNVCEAIDDLAEVLTGDKALFHTKPATTAPRSD